MNLRELAEQALQCWFCESGLDSEEGLARDKASRDALFAAIEQCEKDAALGANVRAVVEMDTLCLSEFRGIYRTMDVLDSNGPLTDADTLDEAVAALRKRLETEG